MNLAFISSQGGHVGQIKLIFTNKVIGNKKAILITESSTPSSPKEKSFNNKYKTYLFKKDNLGFNPIKYLTTMLKLIKIYKKEKIDLIVTNGAQISIPAVMAAKFLGIRTLFIDTVIRVKTPNWSARACYPFSDIFLVQHQNMAGKYGKRAKYMGSIL